MQDTNLNSGTPIFKMIRILEQFVSHDFLK